MVIFVRELVVVAHTVRCRTVARTARNDNYGECTVVQQYNKGCTLQVNSSKFRFPLFQLPIQPPPTMTEEDHSHN